MAARSPSATRSGARAHGSWPRWSTSSSARAAASVSRRCARAAAWPTPRSSSGSERVRTTGVPSASAMVDVVWFGLKVLAALVAAVVIYVIGARSIGNFSKSDPPPDPSEVPLEDVDYRYRCIVCGAQLVLFAAPEGDMPDAPRHCREPMVLVTPVE